MDARDLAARHAPDIRLLHAGGGLGIPYAASDRPLDLPRLGAASDVLATALDLPAPRSGDLLAVLDCGAYGFTESMPLFLSHPLPAELVTERGVLHVHRPRSDAAPAAKQ